MIRFCDKDVYYVLEGEMTRDQALGFFLSEDRRLDVIVLRSRGGDYRGIITYKSLLTSKTLDASVNSDTLLISENFWDDARKYFRANPDALLTVVGKDDEILGFAYNDPEEYAIYHRIRVSLDALQYGNISTLVDKKYKKIKMIVITDLNEFAWRCFRLFEKWGYKVCVVGEKWEWFGLKSCQGYLDYPDFSKLYIYAEGTEAIREEFDGFRKKNSEVIRKAFDSIVQIAEQNMKYVYAAEIGKLLKKGISVFEVSIPERDRIKKTDLEEKSIRLNARLHRYLSGDKGCTKEMEECLFEVYGGVTIEKLKEEGYREESEMIPLGHLYGKTMKPIRYRKRIYLIGPCIVDGYGCLEEDTLYAQLQKLVHGMAYQVIAVPIPVDSYNQWESGLADIPIRYGDIIVVINEDHWFPNGKRGCRTIDLAYIYNCDARKTMFGEITLHTNKEGNRLIAEAMYQSFLKDEMLSSCSEERNCFLQSGELLTPAAICGIDDYVSKIKRADSEIAGAIVMNSNPFTFGHRYLIEYAAAQVDILYVFVVEEDRSFFKFQDRFDMVRRGTADITNVIVVPSGKWVLSYSTMPIYFEKEKRQEVEVDARFDLEVFARYIAPKLGIRKRFVGEEPFDKVTRQYNEQMKEIFGLFGLGLEEISRLKTGDEIISASRVRQLMQENRLEKLKRYVPETTYEVCLKYNY